MIRTLQIWQREERVDFYLDGDHLARADHDEDGWHGMARIEGALVELAIKLGCNTEHVDGSPTKPNEQNP